MSDDLRNERRNWEYNPGPDSPQMTRQRWIRWQQRKQTIIDILFFAFFLAVLFWVFGTDTFNFLSS